MYTFKYSEFTANDSLDVNAEYSTEDGSTDDIVISVSADAGVSAASELFRWYLNGGTTSITLSDYGITYESTPSIYDTITVTVTAA